MQREKFAASRATHASPGSATNEPEAAPLQDIMAQTLASLAGKEPPAPATGH